MVASKKELALTLEHVNQILELRIPENDFYWLVSTGRRVNAGNKAGTLTKKGYTWIRINGNSFYAHRLVWFLTYGEFPEGVIDHLDGDPSNNKVENLRDVTNKVNRQNMSKRNRRDVDLPTGVVVGYRNKFDEVIAYYAHWCDMNGKKCTVYFGIREWHNLEAALFAAVARRELEMTSLMSLGANYTERHGLS